MQTSHWDQPASCMSSQPLWSPQPPDFCQQRFLQKRFLQLCWLRVCVKFLSEPRWSGQRVHLLPHSVHEFCSNTQPHGELKEVLLYQFASSRCCLIYLWDFMRKDQEKWFHETAFAFQLWSPKIRGPPHLVASLQCTQVIAPNLCQEKWQQSTQVSQGFPTSKRQKPFQLPLWKAPNPATHLALFRWFLAKHRAPQSFNKPRESTLPSKTFCLAREAELWLSPPCLLCHAHMFCENTHCDEFQEVSSRVNSTGYESCPGHPQGLTFTFTTMVDGQ